jgi:anion-transporting  ArsA/GET3 family ATPase
VADEAKFGASGRPGIRKFLRAGHTIILLGTGGVGKTTVAGALGIAAAEAGIRTGVITIDPARRLRDALGLRRLGDRPTRIEARRLARAGLDPRLELFAMVLDVRRQWDAMVDRLVSDPAARATIRQNRFYRRLAGQLAGSDAYAALEALHDLHETERFGVAIVDTPPAAQAFDFIQAPGRMARLLDSGAARLFSSAAAIPGSRLALGFAGRAARRVIDELERFTGIETLSSIAEFFTAAASASNALIDRFRKAEAMLRAPTVHFVIVTTAELDRLNHARELIGELRSAGLAPAAVVINRFLDPEAWEARGATSRVSTPAALRSAANHDPELRAALEHLENYRRGLNAAAARVADFARGLPGAMALAAAPALSGAAADLMALRTIGAYLSGGKTPQAPEHAMRRRQRHRG